MAAEAALQQPPRPASQNGAPQNGAPQGAVVISMDAAPCFPTGNAVQRPSAAVRSSLSSDSEPYLTAHINPGKLDAPPAWPKDAPVAPSAPRDEWVRGDPGPFGLLCFGMTTSMLMFVETTWAEKAFLPTVIFYAFAYGGGGQLIAGILELIKGNTFGGTVFASYGCFWLGWAGLELLELTTDDIKTASITGKTLWCGLWAILSTGFGVVSLRKNHALLTIFFTLVITFCLLAGGVKNANAKEAAGYIGLFCGGTAIYAALGSLYKIELGITLPGMKPIRYI